MNTALAKIGQLSARLQGKASGGAIKKRGSILGNIPGLALASLSFGEKSIQGDR